MIIWIFCSDTETGAVTPLGQSGDHRYLYHQGNEQTTGGALRAAARPWFIPAGKYIPADRPQRSTPLQRGAPLQPVREVAAL